MAVLKVRTHPCNIYYVTGHDAEMVRDASGSEGDAPCFCTDSFGEDGWDWNTPEEFEESWADGPGENDSSFELIRRRSLNHEQKHVPSSIFVEDDA